MLESGGAAPDAICRVQLALDHAVAAHDGGQRIGDLLAHARLLARELTLTDPAQADFSAALTGLGVNDSVRCALQELQQCGLARVELARLRTVVADLHRLLRPSASRNVRPGMCPRPNAADWFKRIQTQGWKPGKGEV